MSITFPHSAPTSSGEIAVLLGVNPNTDRYIGYVGTASTSWSKNGINGSSFNWDIKFPLKIEAGKWYINGFGQKCFVAFKSSDERKSGYPMIGSLLTSTEQLDPIRWTPEGKYDRYCATKYDLLKECDPPC